MVISVEKLLDPDSHYTKGMENLHAAFQTSQQAKSILTEKKPLLPLQYGFATSLALEFIILSLNKDLANLSVMTQAILGAIPVATGLILTIIRAHSSDRLLQEAEKLYFAGQREIEISKSLSPNGRMDRKTRSGRFGLN